MTRKQGSGFPVLAAMLLIGSLPAAAQSRLEDPTLSPPIEAAAPTWLDDGATGITAEEIVEDVAETEGMGGAFGVGLQDYWVAATRFHPRLDYEWRYHTFLYHYAGTEPGTHQYEAQVELPAGAKVEFLECFFYDADAGQNGTVYFLEQSYDYDADVPGATTIATVSSSGSSGYQKPWTSLNETIRYRDGADRNVYTLMAGMPGDHINVRFRGCRFHWRRQITPAPATATFDDVPTGHLFFQQIEALVDSGITAGCGGDDFCPNAPLTRGQMAAFLAKALGLHWPY